MNHQNIQRMNDFFAERIAGCEQRGTALKADERGDEAVNEKVRANIFDVFRTVLSAAEKAGRGDAKAVRSFFRDRLETIPSGWAVSYEKAREHDDAVRMQIEKIKLDAAAEIREYFDQVWEEES